MTPADHVRYLRLRLANWLWPDAFRRAAEERARADAEAGAARFALRMAGALGEVLRQIADDPETPTDIRITAGVAVARFRPES